jgi:transketolase N-terminal domain/subunit
MLELTDKQLAGIGEQLLADRVVTMLREHFPEATTADWDTMTREAGELATVASSSGVQSDVGQGLFVAASWLLGSGFEKNHPRLVELLADPEMDEVSKLEGLVVFVLAYEASLSGEKP